MDVSLKLWNGDRDSLLLRDTRLHFWLSLARLTQLSNVSTHGSTISASHLQTATIWSDECDIPELEMLKELAFSSRASTTCEFLFD
ncbi:hypothetical protein F2Q70_00005216 [Brassica cretica]|uniref:Uncharacterized protein n=1 Tax=Brassica cretica TaxID=69181 RepID=A0A8S9ITV4_BRACR|nr:hypothetical protein F2Q70_00005216 [Brassica cretica]